MAKNNNRTERTSRSDRNVNRAMLVLVAGIVAEFYLLMVKKYFVEGSVAMMLTMSTVLTVLCYVGCALFGAGLVWWVMRKKWTRWAEFSPWLLGSGFFFAVTSRLMLMVYPQATEGLCILVPAAMLIAIVFLLYPREFSLEATALAAVLSALFLIHRGAGRSEWFSLVLGCCIFALCAIAALIIAVFKAKKNGGVLPFGVRIVSIDGSYPLIFAVLFACFAAILLALFVSAIAYYGLWLFAIATFLLAVYYTIRMM